MDDSNVSETTRIRIVLAPINEPCDWAIVLVNGLYEFQVPDRVSLETLYVVATSPDESFRLLLHVLSFPYCKKIWVSPKLVEP